jgi:dihydrofolate synthase/folylpolyglutamate synthase
MFSHIGAAAFKKDITNTVELCKALDNPHKKFRSIHVAGTNGKGSVSHMLAAIFQTAGYKTGLYTSPHLKDFRERIRINGLMVKEQFVVDFTEKTRSLLEKIEPSFFELTVAMAFEYFALEKVDIAIIETGLGGRLDSTNIIEPELAVITNIGWDHMNILGDTLEKIAFEKGGIIKKNTPVVLGESLPETLPVFTQICTERNAELQLAQQKRKVLDWRWEKNYLVTEVSEDHNTDHNIFHLDLIGLYQVKNLVTVLEACDQMKLKGWKISDDQIEKALQQTKKITGLHGRWDVIHQHPQVVLDVAHNSDGIKQLVQQIEITPHDRLHIILGMVKDKDIENVLALLPKTATYYFTNAQIPRALPANELAEAALNHGLQGKVFTDVNIALRTVLEHAHKDDLVLVCGSVFLVGEVNTSIH